MRKVDDGEKRKKRKNKKKITSFLVATNVVESAAQTPTDWNSARSCQMQ